MWLDDDHMVGRDEDAQGGEAWFECGRYKLQSYNYIEILKRRDDF